MWEILTAWYSSVRSLLNTGAVTGWKQVAAPIVLLLWCLGVVWVFAPLVTSLPKWLVRQHKRRAWGNKRHGGKNETL